MNGRLAELFDENFGRRASKDAVGFGHRARQRFLRHSRWVTVGDTHGGVNELQRRGPRKIDDLLLGNTAVGHDDVMIIAGAHGKGAPVHLRHLPFLIAHHHPIAHREGPLDLQGEPGHHVAQHILQGKADHGGHNGGGDKERAELHAEDDVEHSQRRREHDDDVEQIDQQSRHDDMPPLRQKVIPQQNAERCWRPASLQWRRQRGQSSLRGRCPIH